MIIHEKPALQTRAFSQYEALYWEAGPNRTVICRLCPHQCRIQLGKAGLCRVRVNQDGRLVAAAYGRVTSMALDPIEKKPLFDYFPGSQILSVGSYGCNFRCRFCQNWAISQQEAPWRKITPDVLIDLAKKEVAHGNIGLAYTYNEPMVHYEYVRDCARKAREADLKNVLVTNGYINPEPLESLLPWIDAMNIDLKGWQPSFYKTYCGGTLEPVLETIRMAIPRCHVELTTLLIPGLNDADEDIESMAKWIASIDSHTIWHLTRHHPDYQMPEPPPIRVERMKDLAKTARRYVDRVVLGNIL